MDAVNDLVCRLQRSETQRQLNECYHIIPARSNKLLDNLQAVAVFRLTLRGRKKRSHKFGSSTYLPTGSHHFMLATSGGETASFACRCVGFQKKSCLTGNCMVNLALNTVSAEIWQQDDPRSKVGRSARAAQGRPSAFENANTLPIIRYSGSIFLMSLIIVLARLFICLV